MLTADEYIALYLEQDEFNAYPDGVPEFVYEGDWFVYRLTASNLDTALEDNNGDAFDVVIEDTMPAGVYMFRYETPFDDTSLVFTQPLDTNMATNVVWTIPFL